jgi:starch-binding outer membrane protein, SusD/RagB family
MTNPISLHTVAHRIVLVVAVAVVMGACESFLEVSNPGPTADENLDRPEAVPGIVSGMSGDLSDALDELIFDNSIMADELAHGGSYTPEGLFYRGIVRDEDVNGLWADMHTARWTAEHGIERMRTIENFNFEASAHVTRAFFLAGIANRTLGENVCATAIDGGPEQPHTVHFERAEQQFTEAARLATAQGNSALRLAALAGRASVRAWLGRWDEAVQDAQQVPTSHVTSALYSANSGRERNYMYQETHVRFEITVYNTFWAGVAKDPRVPWDTLLDASGKKPRNGQDGRTPHFRQRKYPSFDTDIPLVKGTEMRVLEAEARLRANDIAGAFESINTMRAFYTSLPDSSFRDLPALAAPATLQEAWPILQRERGAVVWLEGRRLWDLRRWNEETGMAHNSFLDNRDTCIPISQNERLSNPNLAGT